MRDGQERAELHRKIGTLNSGNFIEKLGGSEIARTVIKGFVYKIMNTEEELEREKERALRRSDLS